uniref:Uncharacterized protein n=1 Tax=Rhizophora mucronata TaxID=61149 RepID=A0A2P2N7V9_RHIMU
MKTGRRLHKFYATAANLIKIKTNYS